ncbi:hypothetical protein [Pseudoxanthomonas sp. USHLN014]|uniref:hypothetical protein n=1 Tax=Pseudoxanthomonas sp. USHLN014 TaxID=3081297 RepID=UPI00301CE27B
MAGARTHADPAGWTRWFPTAAPGPGNRWQLVRFERVDEHGKPVGKPIANTAPGGHVRTFATEASAQRVAAFVNAEEGRLPAKRRHGAHNEEAPGAGTPRASI